MVAIRGVQGILFRSRGGAVQVILRSHRLPGWLELGHELRCEARQVSQSKHLIRKTKWEGGGKGYEIFYTMRSRVIPKDLPEVKCPINYASFNFERARFERTLVGITFATWCFPKKFPNDNYKV